MEADRMSAVVLAGGYSSRMGRDKAELQLGEHSLIEWQVEKLKRLGIRDIMLSGYERPINGCRSVQDIYPHRGPLSGIHACLLASENESCLVLGVDMPLVPEKTVLTLIEAHQSGITVLIHGDRIEPLAAVYDRSLAQRAEEILRSEKTAIMRLMGFAEVTKVRYRGDERFLINCNTPEDLAQVETVWKEIQNSTDGLTFG